MARIARTVAPGILHHVTQRGNRRQQTFFNDEDYSAYLELMSEWRMVRNGAIGIRWKLGRIVSCQTLFTSSPYHRQKML